LKASNAKMVMDQRRSALPLGLFLVLLLAAHGATGFYLPGIAPTEYAEGKSS
jgi:hypothetical protein